MGHIWLARHHTTDLNEDAGPSRLSSLQAKCKSITDYPEGYKNGVQDGKRGCPRSESLRPIEPPDFDLNRVWLALAYVGNGDLDRASETATDCELGDCVAILGMIHGMRGHTEEAMEALDNTAVTELESQGPIFQAWIYIAMGDFDAAFERLNRA